MTTFSPIPEQKVIAFSRVRAPWGWLNNMSRHRVMYDGAEWRSAEALFQAMRFAPGHPARDTIRKASSPLEAKQIAYESEGEFAIVPRSEADIANMR